MQFISSQSRPGCLPHKVGERLLGLNPLFASALALVGFLRDVLSHLVNELCEEVGELENGLFAHDEALAN